MKTYYFFFLCLMFLSIGCKHSIVQVPRSISIIEVDVTSNDEMQLSNFFQDVKIVKLETKDNVLLGEINYIVQANNKIYITDVYASTLYIFDKTGKFLSSINKKGQGPGEYIGVTQFVVDRENIVVMSRSLRKLMIYSESGEFLSEHKVNCSALDISLLDNHYYVLYCGNDKAGSENKLHLIDTDNTEKQFIPVDAVRSKYLHYISPYNFFKGTNAVRFFEPYNDTVYTITKDKVEPAFYIDFKGKNIPSSFYGAGHENIMTFAQSLMQHEYAAGVFRFAESEQTKMFFTYYQWNKAKLTLYDMQNKISRTFSSIYDDVVFKSLVIPVNDFKYFASENIIFPVNASNIVEWRNNYQIDEKYKDVINAVNEDDNQVLFIFNLK